jgi:DNA-binding transcriptional MerR regulator
VDDLFTTQHIIKAYKVSHQTVKNWCDEFRNYLSRTAVPEPGKKRLFTADDVEVLALVAEFSKRGQSYEDAHTALRAGQRGQLPDPLSDEDLAVPPAMLMRLREELTQRDAIIASLTTERDRERGKVELLQTQLSEKDKQIRDLYIEIAKLQARD